MNTLDDNEAELRAANEALARRREAIRRGDQGSPIEPVTFCPLHRCEHCDCELTAHARSHIIGVCQRCLEELVAQKEEAQRRREAEQAKKDAAANRKASRAFWPMMSLVLLGFLVACYIGAVKAGWL